MKWTIVVCVLLLTLVMPVVLQLRADEKPLAPGDAAPAWIDLPGVDGKKHSLAELQDKDVVVVVFTCNSCPIAEDYEGRILAFHKEHCGAGKKVELVAINVNLVPEDRLPKMQERAERKGMRFAYLFDESQKIARDYGATVTPEFFVLDKQRKLVYRGAMDDRNAEKQVAENYLEPAVAAALAGQPPAIAETRGRGCAIKYARRRDQ